MEFLALLPVLVPVAMFGMAMFLGRDKPNHDHFD